MRTIPALALVFTLLLASCGGGPDFVPNVGPFSGQFLVETTSNGTFTFTANNGALGGTGSLVHNAQPVTVTISANIFGSTISGVIQNANLGSGTFTGRFDQVDQAYGDYTYTDAAGLTTQTGTWTALTD
jgi:hypothetical protein